ncbi:MAG: tyrosine-type recombinase/integrase [Methanomassiliicoccales archaeon]|nr:tyrosine-type recombinase/integrase [Methanomassiliicoccales archaeon]
MGSRDDALDEEQYEQLLQAADPDRPEELLILLLAGDLGMREGEIAHLQRSWLNFQKGHIIIPSSDRDGWTPKTRWGARTIPALKMSRRAWDAVRAYFTAYERLGIHRITVYRIVQRIAERSGLEARTYPHSLRVTAATRLAYKVKNPRVLCDLFGWGQLKIAQYYIQRAGGLAEEELERAFM